ncbi:MAG: CoA transferase [Pseudomonadota bacterium]
MTDARALLAGQRVLEWVPPEQPRLVHLAVAFAARLLADLGAEVTRIRPEPDPLADLRSATEAPDGAPGVLASFLLRGKATRERQPIATDLMAGSIPLLLLAAGQSLPQLPALVAVVHTAAVPSGSELEGAPISELALQGLVGLTDLFGEPEGQPLMLGGHQSSYATGFSTFCAGLAALAGARFRGCSDTARVNALDALAWVNWKGIAAATLGFPIGRGGKGAEAPVLRSADGAFAFLHLPGNWPAILQEVGDERLAEERFATPGRRAKNARALNAILADWTAGRTNAQLYAFCQREAIPGGPVLDGVGLLDDPLLRHRGFFTSAPQPGLQGGEPLQVPGVPLTIESRSEPSRTHRVTPGCFSSNTPGDLPLSGKLVLDLGIFTAGSVTATLLADLGATVIKVESESYSDPFRRWPGIKGDSPLFTFNNRNKLGFEADLKTAAGRASFLKLVAQADVVVENFRRGVLERLGIGYDVLRQANSRIVLASVSGQGASGPGSSHVSFGSTLEAIGGIAALTGYPDGDCYISGRNLNYPDQIVCLYGAGAVIAALLQVDETDSGLHLDVSQREVTTLTVGETVAAASRYGASMGPQGNGDLNAALQDVFAVRDGWLCVTVPSDLELGRLAQLVDAPVAALSVAVERWLAAQSKAHAIAQLRPLGIAVAPANSGAQAAAEPAIRSSVAFSTTPSGAMVKGFPFQFDRRPMKIYGESPAMGAQTAQIRQALADRSPS